MRKAISIFLIAFFIGFSSIAQDAADCNQYYPLKAGESRTYTTYDKKGKITGTSTQNIISVNKIEGGVEIVIGLTVNSEDSDTAVSSQFTATCKDGVYSVSMDNFLDPAVLGAYEGMELEIESDNIDLPAKPTAGQKLKDGSIRVKVNSGGNTLFTLTVNVTNRMVAAIEDVTTPAGEYNCTKITYDIESRFAFIRSSSKAAEWYAKDIGLVKSETYDKKGKLESYSLLTAVN